MSCADARDIDLVNYLHQLGYNPKKIRGKEYWYLSPLRTESNPSFKVDRGRNIWYDHGLGNGGTMIDFGLLFHRCSLPELLNILSETKDQNFSFHPQLLAIQNDLRERKSGIKIIRSESLQNHSLVSYVLGRGISLERAKKYFEQITFRIDEKEFLALGFRNNSGGYELRSARFKGSSSPKDSTIFQEDKEVKTIAVFEGIFSFLSYLELKENDVLFRQKTTADIDTIFEKNANHYLVLNSLSFFEKRRETMEMCPKINLYLDRDKAGVEATQKALQWSQKYRDKSSFYKGHKDLNDYLVHLIKQSRHREPKQSQGKKRSV